jgi:hypothetical protein
MSKKSTLISTTLIRSGGGGVRKLKQTSKR